MGDVGSGKGAVPRRFRALEIVEWMALELPVASTTTSRLLGLMALPRESAGRGLVIPRCSCVHTFGMLFHLDLYFCDRAMNIVRTVHLVPPGRLLWEPRAFAVVEIPAQAGG